MLFTGYDNTSLHNYCLGGVPDKKDVHYVRMGDMRNIKSLMSFGYIKPSTDCYVESGPSSITSSGPSHKRLYITLLEISYIV